MLRRLQWSIFACLLSLAAAGCASSPAVRAAEAGHFSALRRALSDALQRGDLDESETRAVARAVAAGEVARVAPPSGADRLRQLRTCARHVEEPLLDRAGGTDVIAPAAMLLLLEEGLLEPEEVKRRAGAMPASGAREIAEAFRVVHTRALVATDDGSMRRRRMLDGDQEVRLAALRAAIAAADPSDRDALLDVARLDPHPLARSLAIRAAGALGGEMSVLTLRDIWVLADEPAREAIVEAWATPRAIDAGGRDQLLWAVTSQRGAPAIAAARLLSRGSGLGAADAVSVLVQAMGSGISRDRAHAILSAPLKEPSVRAALLQAQRDPDEAVAFAAFSRVAEAPMGVMPARDRATAVAWLLKLATGGSTRAILARGVLARARVREATPLLERDLQAKDDRLREAAGTALVELGELPRTALLLADADARVRTSVACAILGAR